MLKDKFVEEVYEKFKNKFYFLLAHYDETQIAEDALKIELQKYSLEIPEPKITQL